jgi:hypothetical protein
MDLKLFSNAPQNIKKLGAQSISATFINAVQVTIKQSINFNQLYERKK